MSDRGTPLGAAGVQRFQETAGVEVKDFDLDDFVRFYRHELHDGLRQSATGSLGCPFHDISNDQHIAVLDFPIMSVLEFNVPDPGVNVAGFDGRVPAAEHTALWKIRGLDQFEFVVHVGSARAFPIPALILSEESLYEL